jgi:ABC-2 type transport system ATP-binding protein
VSAPIVEARGLTRRFGDFTAVDGVDLSIAAGEIFAFLGANGSGKSTTIRMLIGLLEPSAGRVRVDGVDVRAQPREVRDRIGYMGQKVSLYQGLTIRENVEFYAGLHGLDGSARARRWGAVRERFGLADAEQERPENLSAGVRQRAGLALASLHEPRILFLDEPTAGVDVASRALFWERIQEEADAGRTVFVTTHFLEEVDACARLALIADGRLVVPDATPESLRAEWTDGYRIEAPGALAPEAVARLREEGFAVEPGASGAGGDEPTTRLRIPALGSEALDALASALGPRAAAVRIEQPALHEAFRRVISGAQQGARP